MTLIVVPFCCLVCLHISVLPYITAAHTPVAMLHISWGVALYLHVDAELLLKIIWITVGKYATVHFWSTRPNPAPLRSTHPQQNCVSFSSSPSRYGQIYSSKGDVYIVSHEILINITHRLVWCTSGMHASKQQESVTPVAAEGSLEHCRVWHNDRFITKVINSRASGPKLWVPWPWGHKVL